MVYTLCAVLSLFSTAAATSVVSDTVVIEHVTLIEEGRRIDGRDRYLIPGLMDIHPASYDPWRRSTPAAIRSRSMGENYSRLVEHPEYLDQPLYVASLSPAGREQLKTVTCAEWQPRRFTP